VQAVPEMGCLQLLADRRAQLQIRGRRRLIRSREELIDLVHVVATQHDPEFGRHAFKYLRLSIAPIDSAPPAPKVALPVLLRFSVINAPGGWSASAAGVTLTAVPRQTSLVVSVWDAATSSVPRGFPQARSS
jgi:hypothetical protein